VVIKQIIDDPVKISSAILDMSPRYVLDLIIELLEIKHPEITIIKIQLSGDWLELGFFKTVKTALDSRIVETIRKEFENDPRFILNDIGAWVAGWDDYQVRICLNRG
jgi:hypothetical protein